jgi:protein-S-isoprenylcysteine O-methyltransferase Ste14
VIGYVIGASAYFAGLGGFLAGLLGPYSINAGVQGAFWPALITNMSLIILFGLPHSLMPRQRFKQWWKRIIPPAAEHGTFMLQAGLLALLLIWQWQPMTGVIWQIDAPVLRGMLWVVYWSGWLIAFIATFLIDHFELTGLKQVFAHLRNRPAVYPRFRTPFLYKVVRHPMQFGVILAFWSPPEMTGGRLIFALGMTTYILIGLYFDERDLVRRFGDAYRACQQQTPMLIPYSQKISAIDRFSP